MRFKKGDMVEWTDAYGGTQWGRVLSIEPGGRIYVDMLSFRGRPRSKPSQPAVFWGPHETHQLRPRAALHDQRKGEGNADGT